MALAALYHSCRFLRGRRRRRSVRLRFTFVEMVQYFRVYLAGRFFIVRTDHDSLKGMKQLSKLTGQMALWIDFLEGFQFEIRTRPGKEHDNADFLSRLYTDCFCKHREHFAVTETAAEALKDEPVTDWELFDKCCREQADRRIRDKRTEILRITDPEALRTLSDRDFEEQITIAAKQAPTQEYGSHVNLVRTVRLCCHKQAESTQQEKEDFRSDVVGEQMRRWVPVWTKDEMKTHRWHVTRGC